jgi:PAX-interacting protein 1
LHYVILCYELFVYFCFAVPPDLFLLGCIFMIVDYDSSMPEEVMMWKHIIASSGGEVETVYGPRVTHVLCETQKSATFQRVTSTMSSLSLAVYLF